MVDINQDQDEDLSIKIKDDFLKKVKKQFYKEISYLIANLIVFCFLTSMICEGIISNLLEGKNISYLHLIISLLCVCFNIYMIFDCKKSIVDTLYKSSLKHLALILGEISTNKDKYDL